MFLVDRQKVAADSRHGSAGSMKLRVRADGQLVELPLGKITIGSGPRCNLRIERPGVEPLHCLIVHGAEGLRVRRWATDTRLNGATFDDAPLSAGDCLELGSVELDLVDPLAAALDSLAELMPLLEAEKPVGLLPYYPVVEAPVEVAVEAATFDGVSAEVATESELSSEIEEETACFEAASVVKAENACEYEVTELTSRERETINWEDIERSIAAGLDDAESEPVVTAGSASECANEVEFGEDEDAASPDVRQECVAKCVEVWPLVAEEMAAIAELDSVADATECSVVVDDCEAGVEECDVVEEPTEIDTVEDAVNDLLSECVDGVEEVSIEDRVPMDSVDAVEVVFQELQAACSMARGRNRKMLAALRGLRAEKESLELRIAGTNGQLPGLADKMDAWEADRDLARNEQRELHSELQEVRRQLGEWEARFAEHLDQMVTLQRELEATRRYSPSVAAPQMVVQNAQVVKSAMPAAVAAECVAEELSVEPCSNAQVERMEHATEALLSLPAVESAAVSVQAANERDVVPEDVRAAIEELMHDSIAEPKTTEVEFMQVASGDPWEMPAEPKADWLAPVDAEPTGDEAAARVWGEVPRANVNSEGELSSLGSLGSANEVARSAWDSDESSGNEEASDDASPFAEFSIWKQGGPVEAAENAGADEIATEQPKADEVAAWGTHAFESVEVAKGSDAIESGDSLAAEVDANPWAKNASESVEAEVVEPVSAPVQQSSFIDRYSHLFAEEDKAGAAGAVEKAIISPMPVEKSQPLMPVRSESKPIGGAAGSDDEESIEQYMAKLLQRVRGDSAPSVASQVTGIRASVNPSATSNDVNAQKLEAPAASASPVSDGPQLSAEEQEAEAAVNWEAFTKRAATAPATNLGALRALANETARRDISRHELRTFKRNAVTKVIVSMLAGMTSLWLMLDSPNWLDTQFIAACVALIVAAYWAGEACRAMLTSMRAAASYGSRSRVVEEAALPIDVEGEAESNAVDSASTN